MLGGFPPFDISPDTSEYQKHEFTSPFFDLVTKEAKDVVNIMLAQDAGDRGTCETVMQLVWWEKELMEEVRQASGKRSERTPN